MSRIHRLELTTNAIDSLEESIRYYQIAVKDKTKYKFCIILYFHFIELMLKSCVEYLNPLLCYAKPFSNKIDNEKTINCGQTISILRNSDIQFDKSLEEDIRKIAKIRNDIIHYKFEFSTAEIRKLIIKTLIELFSLYEKVTNTDLRKDINQNTLSLIDEIDEEYKAELHLAQAKAQENSEYGELSDCNFCGSIETCVTKDKISHCYYCDEEDVYIECARCTQSYWSSEIYYYGETENGERLYMCDYCADLIEDL